MLPVWAPGSHWVSRWKRAAAAAAANSLQSCPTLCNPTGGSPPGSPVPGILQAKTLEWVAISFSNAWKWKEKVKLLSRVRLLATPWTAAYQAPPSMGFSRQEYWSGVPLPSPAKHRETINLSHCLLWCWEQGGCVVRPDPAPRGHWHPYRIPGEPPLFNLRPGAQPPKGCDLHLLPKKPERTRSVQVPPGTRARHSVKHLIFPARVRLRSPHPRPPDPPPQTPRPPLSVWMREARLASSLTLSWDSQHPCWKTSWLLGVSYLARHQSWERLLMTVWTFSVCKLWNGTNDFPSVSSSSELFVFVTACSVCHAVK